MQVFGLPGHVIRNAGRGNFGGGFDSTPQHGKFPDWLFAPQESLQLPCQAPRIPATRRINVVIQLVADEPAKPHLFGDVSVNGMLKNFCAARQNYAYYLAYLFFASAFSR